MRAIRGKGDSSKSTSKLWIKLRLKSPLGITCVVQRGLVKQIVNIWKSYCLIVYTRIPLFSKRLLPVKVMKPRGNQTTNKQMDLRGKQDLKLRRNCGNKIRITFSLVYRLEMPPKSNSWSRLLQNGFIFASVLLNNCIKRLLFNSTLPKYCANGLKFNFEVFALLMAEMQIF